LNRLADICDAREKILATSMFYSPIFNESNGETVQGATVPSFNVNLL